MSKVDPKLLLYLVLGFYGWVFYWKYLKAALDKKVIKFIITNENQIVPYTI